jgi:valyl-tRNA synthetase
MLDAKYNHKESEKKWQKYWREAKIFAWKNDKPKEETFVIDTPPPTVSGVLHMGHVFSYTQADFIARFQRMNGKDVFYPMGFDDNGLPTERLVEKVIGKKAAIFEKENGAGSFVNKCREEVEKAEIEFEELFNSIALSVDWGQKYQTISADSQKISQSSFVDLAKKGLIYRDFKPVIWDCVDQTALSQADLEEKEMPAKANFINFEAEDGTKIEIMTTRPELLPACVGLLLNPEHSYAKKIGAAKEGKTEKFAFSPVFGVKVPIIIDEDVKIDEASDTITGAVMCCTYGDENDVKWVQKYGLFPRELIEKYGKITEFEGFSDDRIVRHPTNFNLRTKDLKDNNSENFLQNYKNLVAGKKIKQAREDFIKFLDENSYLTRPSKDLVQRLKCAERSGAPIEYISQNQWFIRLLPFKEELKKQIEKCTWHPDFMKVRALQWCENLNQDWCISRQRFFGVPIPAWQVGEFHEGGASKFELAIADFTQLPCDPKVDLPKFLQENEGIEIIYNKRLIEKSGKKYLVIPETDILDTWATSSISPQLSSHGISDEICLDKTRHEKLFPADLRPQAHEIIRTWAFYTICKAYLHNLDENQQPKPSKNGQDNSIPWKNLMISGWCLASDKTKMSKSKGNVVTPTSLIEEKGSDAVRYWASTSHLGADTAYSDDVFKIGQKLITKVFNASKFASMNFDLLKNENDAKITEIADLWILSKMNLVIKNTTSWLEKFEYAKAREVIEDFFWNDFCDNYLEIIKVRSYGLNAQKLEGIDFDDEQKLAIKNKQLSSILTLRKVLNALLKLFSPFIPHICEEIYSEIFVEEFLATKSINARGNWPKAQDFAFDEIAKKIGEEALKVIFAVRKFKSEQNLSIKSDIKLLEIQSEIDLKPICEDLGNVCNAIEVKLSKGDFLVKIS